MARKPRSASNPDEDPHTGDQTDAAEQVRADDVCEGETDDRGEEPQRELLTTA
jgi:hypothetical protein